MLVRLQTWRMQTATTQYWSYALWYLLFGALHEISHATALLCLSSTSSWYDISIVEIFLLRGFSLSTPDLPSEDLEKIRNAGWISSILIAVCLHLVVRNESSLRSGALTAAWMTAADALATDFFRCKQFLPYAARENITFYCGNFGIILLHNIWLQNGAKDALDCLEQMVNITMMRGAQSGGVVTFEPTDSKIYFRGIRKRVVNRKRTDLSKEIRRRVTVPQNLPTSFVPTFMGHTRFATSSLSTLDGTHPHRWTPTKRRRFYSQLLGETEKGSQFEARPIDFENFITHNGDFDFYELNGKTHDLDTIQQWLVAVTETPLPASVDSVAIAGMIDVIHCQGCFGLAVRYTAYMGLENSTMLDPSTSQFPPYAHFQKIGDVFEECMDTEFRSSAFNSLVDFGSSITARATLARRVCDALEQRLELIQPLSNYILLTADAEIDGAASLYSFCTLALNAFFDNDLFFSTQMFLKYAKGSFGLVVASSVSAGRQIVIAARGQPMSIGFFPQKRLICYGSEQAAVKAGMNAHFRGDDASKSLKVERRELNPEVDATRLDLDDLGGEIVLLDWGTKSRVSPVSKPNRLLPTHVLMKKMVSITIHQESKSSISRRKLNSRLTRLSRNELIKAPPTPSSQPVLEDMQDIPLICKQIQDSFGSHEASTGLNRLTAFHLSRCLRSRLEARIKGSVAGNAVDVLVTGCEVSLWLGEQFASDLKKCFPKLSVEAISSNKILGMYGQEIAVPSLGFSYDPKTSYYHDTIVLIISHSGGTFAPLSCSNLLQSATKNIFVVTGDWDTQIGKNLRILNQIEDGGEHFLNKRIFCTGVGIRPAEPCSLSVVATHQLLTNLLEYVSVVILSDPRFSRVTGAAVNAMDIQILERCNQMNVDALTEIVGVNVMGYSLDHLSRVLVDLRAAGDLWAEHVLENARAYIMTFLYIFGTVVSGYPLAYAVAYFAGLSESSRWVHAVSVVDAAIYFFLPQINIIIIRLVQGRNILHRMTARTVAIADIPWVAQSAEAFLSKIFAVSYSIAGVNVVSGNPVDHFVHRHTHRVVRGTLAIFGRPDGRLSALSTAEASVCLSMNQASSIQSWGGTCESITIGHNPFKLDLSLNGIFLKRHRPLFLCERLLVETDASQEKITRASIEDPDVKTSWRSSLMKFVQQRKRAKFLNLNSSVYNVIDCSVSLKIHKFRSAPALLGAYLNIDGQPRTSLANDELDKLSVERESENVTVDDVLRTAVQNRRKAGRLHNIFDSMDKDGDGVLNQKEFVDGICTIHTEITRKEAFIMFRQLDVDATGTLSYHEFTNFVENTGFKASTLKLPPLHRDRRGIIQIEAAKEKYFGDKVRKMNSARKSGPTNQEMVDFELAKQQHLAQELYETRIASMQRFVSMCIVFHQMGQRVQLFFSTISFGLWSYRMDRTHSIMRIATTASPISGADVRQQMSELRLLKQVEHSVNVISNAYLSYKDRNNKAMVKLAKAHSSKGIDS